MVARTLYSFLNDLNFLVQKIKIKKKKNKTFRIPKEKILKNLKRATVKKILLK